jgi:hypothetical protein
VFQLKITEDLINKSKQASIKTSDENAKGKGNADIAMNPNFVSQNKTERILLYSRP